MKIMRDESGQAMLFSLLCMTCLLGFVALAADVGTLFHARREMQTAADAAAIAGAAELNYGDSMAAADDASSQNGVANGTNGGVVTVNNPPLYGNYKGVAGYVEAIVSQPQTTFFMKVFGRKMVTVSARAVATNGSGSGCIDTLGTSGTDILMNGSVDLTVKQCSLVDDSDGSQALLANGSVDLTAASIGVVGGVEENGSVSISPTPVTGIVPVSNPLAFLTPPSFSTTGCAANPNINGSGTYTIQPGCYNGITINGSATVTFAAGNYTINGTLLVNGSATVSLGAGLYETNDGITFNGSGTISGADVTFYIDGGALTVNGSQNLNVSAPTSGTYDGILFYQDASDTQQATINGSSSAALSGILYFPTANMTINGSSNTTLYTAFVTNSLTLNGSLTVEDYAVLNGSSPLTATRLVE